MITRFLVYGVVGWCLEIIWTGLHSFFRKDFTLVSTTSIWMFFIYGLVVLFEPLYPFILTFPIIVRGGFYASCIFLVEFIIGSVMTKMNLCPWNYENSKFSINGVIRLDYAPVWATAGFVYEVIYRFLMKI